MFKRTIFLILRKKKTDFGEIEIVVVCNGFQFSAFLALFATPTDILVVDDFESGVLNTQTWCLLDLYCNSANMNMGKLPRIEWLGGEHGYVLHSRSLGSDWRQQAGTLQRIPALEDEDILAYQMEVFQNRPSKMFAIIRKYQKLWCRLCNFASYYYVGLRLRCLSARRCWGS